MKCKHCECEYMMPSEPHIYICRKCGNTTVDQEGAKKVYKETKGWLSEYHEDVDYFEVTKVLVEFISEENKKLKEENKKLKELKETIEDKSEDKLRKELLFQLNKVANALEEASGK